LLVLKTISELF